MQVICTFVLDIGDVLVPTTTEHNEKPSAKYHNEIAKLLLWDQVKGIASPDTTRIENTTFFNIFDLNEKLLTAIEDANPKLIADQVAATPTALLRAPDAIKKKYFPVAKRKSALVGTILSKGTTATWEAAIKKDPDLIIVAPETLDNWEDRVVDAITKNRTDAERLIRKAPASLLNNFKIMSKICHIRSGLIGGGIIPPTVNGYIELCKIAVQQDPRQFEYLPVVARRDPELRRLAGI